MLREKGAICSLKFKLAGMIHEMTMAPKVNQDSDECDGKSAPGSVAKPHGMQLKLGETLRKFLFGRLYWGSGERTLIILQFSPASLILGYLLCIQKTPLQSQICLSSIWVPLVCISQT